MRWRGVGTSLHPARDAARAAGRALLPPMPTGGGRPSEPLPPPSAATAAETAPAGVRVGEWVLDQDPDSGALIARHEPTGQVRELAAPSTDNQGG